jgi:WD40 repeat protein
VVASTSTGNIAETLHDHDGAVIAVEFRPNGELVTAGANGAIVTWDLGDWSAEFRTDTFTEQTASVKLDERTVALEQPHGNTQVIVADPAAWMKRACQVAGRVLTEQEWAEHLGARPYAPACRQ